MKVLYAPDYVINAGGLINSVYYEYASAVRRVRLMTARRS